MTHPEIILVRPKVSSTLRSDLGCDEYSNFLKFAERRFRVSQRLYRQFDFFCSPLANRQKLANELNLFFHRFKASPGVKPSELHFQFLFNYPVDQYQPIHSSLSFLGVNEKTYRSYVAGGLYPNFKNLPCGCVFCFLIVLNEFYLSLPNQQDILLAFFNSTVLLNSRLNSLGSNSFLPERLLISPEEAISDPRWP